MAPGTVSLSGVRAQHDHSNRRAIYNIDWPQSLMSIIFSKTEKLSKIAIYKLYLEVEVLGLDIRVQ